MKKIFTIFLSLMLVVACSIPVFAAEEKPFPEFVPDDNTGYIITEQGDYYYCYAFNSSRYKIGVDTTNYDYALYAVSISGNENYPEITKYRFDKGGSSWSFLSSLNANASQSVVPFGFSAPLETNVSGYDYNLNTGQFGNKVFPQTPPLQELVAVEMEQFQKVVVGMMKILTLCGVGCLALLMGLKVFGKVLSIFRV